MASTLGKRKRKIAGRAFEANAASRDSDLTLDEDIQAVFRRHFEAQFKPLPAATATKKTVEVVENVQCSDDSDDSEWNGISEGECTLVNLRLCGQRLICMKTFRLRLLSIRQRSHLLACPKKSSRHSW